MTTISNDKSASSIHVPVEDLTDNTCPKCGSDEITGWFVETGDGIAVQKLSCDVCDAIWRNVYDFAAVDLLDEDVVVEIPRELVVVDGKGEPTAGAGDQLVEGLKATIENLRFELEVAYGQNADLERRVDELQTF